jgi:fused signal recognition particle receptor
VEGLLEGASLVAIGVGALALLVGLLAVWRAGRRGGPVGPAAPGPVAPGPVAPGPVAPGPATESPAVGVSGRLVRTRTLFTSALAELVGAGLDDAAWERLEEVLIGADVGVQAATTSVAEVRRLAREQGIRDADGVRRLLRDALVAELASGDRALGRREGAGPTVWLVMGVNGAGKTTTIGKLAAREAAAGRRVVLAAADTFRAAAAEQLGIWAERTGAELVRGAEGADPASVAYAGAEAAAASDADVLIVDTAGRLQNRRELMDELGKVVRVLGRQAGGIDETLLVLDGTVGQNGLVQAAAFHEAADVSGVVITKLDGSSRGGIVVAVQRELGIPVKLVGLGEGIEDLQTFDPVAYVDGMLSD